MKKLKTAISTTAASISILALILLVSGCDKAANGTVLAKVNRTTITTTEFKKQLEDLTPQMQQAVVTDPKARKEFLEDLIGIELVIQEAKRLGLDKEADFKKRQDMLKKELERRIQEEAKNDLFNSVLKKELGDKIGKVAPPTDPEVKEYYTKNLDKIRTATGKTVSFKEIEQQLKMRMMQEKRRELYLEYAKGLKAKAKISVDEKAMETAMTEFSKPADLSSLQVQTIPAPKEETKK
jgi:hypothetical protein